MSTIGNHRRTLKRQALKVMLREYRAKVAHEAATLIMRSAGEPPSCGDGCDCPPCARWMQAQQDAVKVMQVGRWRD